VELAHCPAFNIKRKEMPVKGKSPKEIMKTELKKFKSGTLRSGSKRGPKVKSKRQALAIALEESRKAGNKLPKKKKK